MEEAEEGEVEAGAIVLKGIVVMTSVHKVVAEVQEEEEEVIMQINDIMIGGEGGPEAGVLEEEVDVAEAEAQVGREIVLVQLGKAVLREGQKLNNGTGKESKPTPVQNPSLMMKIAMEVEVLYPMETSIMILVNSNMMMEVMITD